MHNLGTIEVTASGLDDNGSTFTNDGTILLDAGDVVATGKFFLSSLTSLSLTGGAFANNGALLLGTNATATSTNANTFTNAGTIALDTTAHLNLAPATFANSGSISLGNNAEFFLTTTTGITDLLNIGVGTGIFHLRGTLDLAGTTMPTDHPTTFASIDYAGESLRNGIYRPATPDDPIFGLDHIALFGDFGTGGVLTLGPGNSFHHADGSPGRINLIEQSVSLASAPTLDNLILTNATVPSAFTMTLTAPTGATFGPETSILYNGTAALHLANAATLHLAGTIAATSSATLLTAGDLDNSGTIDLTHFAGATIGNLTNSGTLLDSASQLTLSGRLSGTGLIAIGNAGALTIGTLDTGTPGNTIRFTDATGVASLPGIGPLALTLDSFRPGNAVDFSSLPYAPGATALLAGGTLTLTAGLASLSLPFTNPQGGTAYQASPDGIGGTLLTAIPCFASGTRIATPRGPIPVEQLKIGDLVLSAFGGTAPIQWIGHRSVDATRHPDPKSVWPIRIAAGALADNIPSRDLYLSPEHAIHLDGHLIPAHLLINGSTITQVPRHTITYWHLELPQHDLLLAEATQCESYLDTNNRNDFENADGPITLHPTFTADELWNANACAPQCRQGPILETIRARLNARASRASRRAIHQRAP